MFYKLLMDDSRLDVSPDELKKAIRIWITTAPKRMWRDYWAHSETVEKWRPGGSDNRFDPQKALAEFLADRFQRINWTVSRPKPPSMTDLSSPAGSKPPREGDVE